MTRARMSAGTALLAGAFVLATLAGCRPSTRVEVREVSIRGLQQLVLASKTGDAVFEVPVKKDVIPAILTAEALLRIETRMTVDFYVDFAADGARLQLRDGRKTLRMDGARIRAKRPVIESCRVFAVDKSLFINEEREARKVLETITDRLDGTGRAWLATASVSNACRDSMDAFLRKLSQDQGLGATNFETEWTF